MTHSITLNEFISHAGADGPCVAVHTQELGALVPPERVELRTVDGAQIPTEDALYDALAKAWHFPPWFGRNPNALNDFMRDLDNIIDTALRKPPASGYVTEINNAHLLFADQPELLPWLSWAIPFYRDYYRDEASPTAALGLLLPVPGKRLDDVCARWAAASAAFATVG